MNAYLKNSKIEVHNLPLYRLNFNPIERLWKWMKEQVLYNKCYEFFDGFKQAILAILESLSGLGSESKLGLAFSSRVREHFRAIGARKPNS